jgi:DNA-binding response OmpR family regulator
MHDPLVSSDARQAQPPMTAPLATATTRVLVVEDDQDIALLLRHTLEKLGGIVVEVTSSGDAALRAVMDQAPGLILLDLNLPVLSGLEVCRILRGRPGTANIPIIMLTARTSENDRVTGLNLGADDYITKPFSLRELTARVRAVLRRATGEAAAGRGSEHVYRGAHLQADFDAVSVSVDGQPVRLTRREFELLKHLVENRNRVLSRDRLLERVWGYERFVETRSVDVHVGRLRAKLGDAGRQIETVVGLGYRFVD